MKNTLEAIQEILQERYDEVDKNPERYDEPEKTKQQLDEKMEIIRGHLEGRWSLDV